MSFQMRLAQLKDKVEKNLPPRFLKIMQASKDQIVNSGQCCEVKRSGDPVPHFQLKNQTGKEYDSQALLVQGPLVLTFYRGFWCPACNEDLSNLKQYKEEIESLGGSLLAISPEKPEYSRKIIGIQKLNFDILHDQSNQLAQQFGVKFAIGADMTELYRDKLHINLKLYHGDDEWALPMPARFLIDTAGTIRYAEATADHMERPDPEELMKVLRDL